MLVGGGLVTFVGGMGALFHAIKIYKGRRQIQQFFQFNFKNKKNCIIKELEDLI